MNDPREEPRLPEPSDEPGELYEVAPPDPDIVRPRPLLHTVPPKPPLDDEPEEPTESLGELQYSLSDLFLLTTVVALMLGVIASFSWQWHIAAGLAGVGALVAAIVLSTGQVEHPAARRACWLMLVFYALSCIVATVAHWMR